MGEEKTWSLAPYQRGREDERRRILDLLRAELDRRAREWRRRPVTRPSELATIVQLIGLVVVAMVTAMGCSLDHNPVDLRECVPHRGTYEEMFTEREGGTCGPMATKVNAYDSINALPYGCKGRGVLSDDGCGFHREWICEADEDTAPRVVRSDVEMDADWSYGTGVYNRMYLGDCESTYDVTVRRVD